MKKYAVLNTQNIAINLIIADSLEAAEKITSHNCVFISNDDAQFAIGKLYLSGEFVDASVEETP
jgi:hypothetical protein